MFPYKIIDLTHDITEGIPFWNGECGFKKKVVLDYKNCQAEVKFRVQKIDTYLGIGTHIDAPVHCVPGQKTVDQLSLDQLVTSCVVIDASKKSASDLTVTSKDLREFEKKHGQIPKNSCVIFNTGWYRHWNSVEKYYNKHLYPSLDVSCAELLADRGVAGIGIDTLSPDRPSSGFPVHKVLFNKGIYILENVANPNLLPPVGSHIFALPIKIKDATEAPMRLIALVEKISKG